MTCPWCEKEMEAGELVFPGRRGMLYDPLWKADSEKYSLLDRMCRTDGVVIAGLDISGIDNTRVRAEYCPGCGKFILSTRSEAEG